MGHRKPAPAAAQNSTHQLQQSNIIIEETNKIATLARGLPKYDGRAAWEALVNKYNGISNAGRVARYEVRHNSKLQPRQGPDIWLYAMDGARDRLHEHGEVITDQHLADRILKGLPDEYEYVRNCSYNQRDFGLEDVKWTLRKIYAENLARSC